MPRNQPRSLKPVPLTIRSSPDWCSRDSALLRRTKHRLAPMHPALISPPARHRLCPAVLRRWRRRRSSGFRIRLPPKSFDSLSPQANPLRPKAIHATVRGIFLRRFPRPLSWPELERVLPSALRQTLTSGHIFSNAQGTSPSARARTLFSREQAPPVRARSQTPALRGLSALGSTSSSKPPTFSSATFPFRTSSRR